MIVSAAASARRRAAPRRSLVSESGERSELPCSGPGGGRTRSSPGLGRFDDVVYSPDGEWLLLAWRSADQWLFLNPAHPRRVVAVADIAAQFDPGTTSPPAFPAVAGWCCPAGRAEPPADGTCCRAPRRVYGGMKTPRPHLLLASVRSSHVAGSRRLCAAPASRRPRASGAGPLERGSRCATRSSPASATTSAAARTRARGLRPLHAARHAPRADRAVSCSRLVPVYRRPGGQRFAAQALNALAAPVGDDCGGRQFVPELIHAAARSAATTRSVDSTSRRAASALELRPLHRRRLPAPSRLHPATGSGSTSSCAARRVGRTAEVAGRRLRLSRPARSRTSRRAGRDWVGFLEQRRPRAAGQPLPHPAERQAPGHWAG